MASPPPPRFLGPEYNPFLFAAIGEDGNGMCLSVVSALARLDLDPWQEASELARLPVEAAIRRLTGLIAALPDQWSSHRDADSIATRVVALLPERDQLPNAPGRWSFNFGPRSSILWFGLLLLLMVIQGAQLFQAHDLAPAPSGHVHAVPSEPRPPLRSPVFSPIQGP